MTTWTDGIKATFKWKDKDYISK
uniref:Uncharacterized protein n=1 Tax=Arundo donax TaxID=35708 RepID=A0A0A8ZBM4_ARUDO